jgi:hypothetical protein
VSISTANIKTPTVQDPFRTAAKTRLIQLNTTVSALASQLGLARNTVSIAINHPSMLPTVKRRIKKALQLK